MKKHKKLKKIISLLIIICVSSTMILSVSVSAADSRNNNIIGVWTLNEHIQPPNPSNEDTQILTGINFEFTWNDAVRNSTGMVFNVNEIQPGIKTYTLSMLSNNEQLEVYIAFASNGGWESGNFASNFSRTINITSVYGENVQITNTYQWLLDNATKQTSTNTTWITINSTTVNITFEENSTWNEWLNSQYNTLNITTDNTYLYLNNQRMFIANGEWVRITNKILSFNSPTNAYFFSPYDKTFSINNGVNNRTFAYISTITTWAEYVPTNPDFYIEENKVYYLGEHLVLNNIEVKAEDTISDGTYVIRYSDEWYEGYLAGYEYAIGLGGAILDIGSIIDGVISGAKSIFVNSFGFELFGINIASTLISILVIAIVIFVVKKLR